MHGGIAAVRMPYFSVVIVGSLLAGKTLLVVS